MRYLPPCCAAGGVRVREKMLQLLGVRCWHRHLSQPFSPLSPRNLLDGGLGVPMPPYRRQTYVVCLDCGRHFDYDWAHMQVLK
jgi:hypothetical protein